MVVPGIDNKESDDGGYHEQAQADAHNTLLQKLIGTIPRKRKLRFHLFTYFGLVYVIDLIFSFNGLVLNRGFKPWNFKWSLFPRWWFLHIHKKFQASPDRWWWLGIRSCHTKMGSPDCHIPGCKWKFPGHHQCAWSKQCHNFGGTSSPMRLTDLDSNYIYYTCRDSKRNTHETTLRMLKQLQHSLNLDALQKVLEWFHARKKFPQRRHPGYLCSFLFSHFAWEDFHRQYMLDCP